MSHFELLCDRVAFLEAGTVEAMGDGTQMDQKYGRCYIATVKLPDAKRNSVTLTNRIYFRMMEFHQCSYMYNYKGTMMFYVGKAYTTWGELFAALVALKDAEKLPEFSLSDMTLEQIYVGLSRRQILFSGARTGAKLSAMPSSIESPPGPCEDIQKRK